MCDRDIATDGHSNVYSITCYDQVDKCVQQVFDFAREDGLSVALSYGYDFIKIEEMERHIRVPQNVHELTLALQSLQTVPHGNVFVDLVLDTTKRLMPSPKCRNVEVINNPVRPGSNHREVNCINYR